ncbi:MAG: acyltransferase family protein, partial [Pseudomonadota bacterium]
GRIAAAAPTARLDRPAATRTAQPVIAYGALHALDVNYWLSDVSAQVLAPINQNGQVSRANAFLWQWLVGVLVFIQFAGVAVLAEKIEIDLPFRLAGVVRWLAGASFSIYVIHYPAMQAIDAVMPGANDHLWRMAALLAAGLAVCFLFAELFERRLGLLRRRFRPLVSSDQIRRTT